MTTRITITESNRDVFLEISEDEDGKRPDIVDVLGILEVAKVLAVEQA